mmetsp:Transcript_42841/g.74365  ORF Transcript_42841/g.74365 Transcript_42841/m.74365 type:complete len:155 (+) Transcript_42841:172-636(+)
MDHWDGKLIFLLEQLKQEVSLLCQEQVHCSKDIRCRKNQEDVTENVLIINHRLALVKQLVESYSREYFEGCCGRKEQCKKMIKLLSESALEVESMIQQLCSLCGLEENLSLQDTEILTKRKKQPRKDTGKKKRQFFGIFAAIVADNVRHFLGHS